NGKNGAWVVLWLCNAMHEPKQCIEEIEQHQAHKNDHEHQPVNAHGIDVLQHRCREAHAGRKCYDDGGENAEYGHVLALGILDATLCRFELLVALVQPLPSEVDILKRARKALVLDVVDPRVVA